MQIKQRFSLQLVFGYAYFCIDRPIFRSITSLRNAVISFSNPCKLNKYRIRKTKNLGYVIINIYKHIQQFPVSSQQDHFFAQGVIACRISARAKRSGYTRLASSQASLETTREKLTSNWRATREFSPHEFYLVAEPYKIYPRVTTLKDLEQLATGQQKIANQQLPSFSRYTGFNNSNAYF